MHTCPFCSTPSDREFGNVRGHRAYRCVRCAVVFFPRPIAHSADYEEYWVIGHFRAV